MPEPQPHQATSAVGVSAFPPSAHIGLTSSVRGDASGGRAGVLLRRSSTNGTATPLVRRSRRVPRSVPCRSHSLTKPCEQSERASSHRWLATAIRLRWLQHSHLACL